MLLKRHSKVGWGHGAGRKGSRELACETCLFSIVCKKARWGGPRYRQRGLGEEWQGQGRPVEKGRRFDSYERKEWGTEGVAG